MNVRLNEFIVIARASHAFFKLENSDESFLDYDDILRPCSEFVPLIRHTESDIDRDLTSRNLNATMNLKFIFESIIPGLEFNSYVLSRTDKSMENIHMITFPHTRKDNNEVVDVKLAVIATETDVLLVSPFSCPTLAITYQGSNKFAISAFCANLLHKPSSNKEDILIPFIKVHENDKCTPEERLKSIIDIMATDIHMQCEYFLKVHSHVQEYEYKVITPESKEFEVLYSKYADDMNFTVDDSIEMTDYMPIIVKDSDKPRTMVIDHTYNPNASRMESRMVGCESYEDLTTGTENTKREVLVRCPEFDVPKAIKLPYNMTYVNYNTIVLGSDINQQHKLLDCECPIIDDRYVPGSMSIPAVESVSMDSAKELYTTLRQFGISKTSKLYEFIYPILKLPGDMFKSALITAKSIFKASAAIEREESERIKEKMLNDELDVVMDRMDNIFKSAVLAVSLSFVLGGFFVGMIAWLIFRGNLTKSKIKAYERTERRLVSKIREYETKIGYANQESDYKAVKDLTHRMDTYKMMLDKLREVKRESLGKEEKFTDTYKDYQE